MIRGKKPEADLKMQYQKAFRASMLIVFILHVMAAVLFPEFDTTAAPRRRDQIVINMEDIPETKQIQRPPPPPRPAVPIATESEDVPDDVTIENTNLDPDVVFVDIPPPPPLLTKEEVEEEILEFFAVEQPPTIIKEVKPVYPELARKAMLEGQVILRFLVGKDGRVERVEVLKGEEIFRQAAINAVSQFVFKPAIQNDKPVRVWMAMPIRFRLNN